MHGMNLFNNCKSYFIVLRFIGIVLVGWFGVGTAVADSVIVVNSAGDTISLIDPKTYKETSRVFVGKGPHHLMATPDDDALLLGNTSSNDLAFLDRKTGAITKKIAMLDPYQLGFSPDKKWFVTTALRMDYVDIYTGEDVIKQRENVKPVKRVKTGAMPSHMAFSADSKTVYITLQGANKISAINLADQTLTATLEVGREPAGIWISPDQKELWVGMMGSDYVGIIDRATFKQTSKLVTGKGAHNIFARGDGKTVFVSNRVDNTISVVDWQTKKIVDSYSVPGGPDCLEIIPSANEMWVTSRWAQKVTVIDLATKKIKASIPVGRSPHGIYYHQHAPRQ